MSYNACVNAWIIGSKNVTVLAKNFEDLNFYKNSKDSVNPQHFNYAIEFAELWFEILKRFIIPKNLLEKFKKELNNHTLIGENVGDENHQHIKVYNQKDIHFFALIENNSEKICENVDKCKSFLDEYQLKMVDYSKSELIRTNEELNDYMTKLFIETLNRNIKDGGEGSVIYFSKNYLGKEQVIQLCKLKTFEYRFLRKLREKIKQLKKFPTNTKEKTINKIFFESEEILEEEKENIDLNEYIKFAEYVIDFVLERGVDLNYSDNYAYFINLMKDIYEIIKKRDMNLPADERSELDKIKIEKNIELEKLMVKIKENSVKLNEENSNDDESSNSDVKRGKKNHIKKN